MELHGTADSSNTIYCGVSYLNVIGAKVSLLVSKIKLIPLNTLRIPRSERPWCALLSKLINEIKLAIWSDELTD